MVDDTGLTLWRQIGSTLAAEIEEGSVSPNERLPSSIELANRFGVNRHTVLRAVEYLEDRGLVRVERGRGVFATADPLQYQLGAQRWFEQNLLESNRTPSRTVISVAELAATTFLADHLALEVGSSIIRVVLLGEADGQPINYGYHHFPAARFEHIADVFRGFGDGPTCDLSFSKILKRYGVKEFRRKAIRIRSRLASDDQALHLKLDPGDQVLLTDVTLIDEVARPIVHAFTHFSASRVEFVVNT